MAHPDAIAARRRRGHLLWGALALVALALVAAGVAELWVRSSLKRAADLALAGDGDGARGLYRAVARVPWRRGASLEGLGVVDLLEGRIAEGQELLGQAAADGARRPPLALEPLFERWLAAGDYAPARAYAAHLLERDPKAADVRLWAGLAANADGRLDDAEELLTRGPFLKIAEALSGGKDAILGPPLRTPESRERYRRSLASLSEARRLGVRPVVLDRTGRVILNRVLPGDELRLAEPAARALVESGGGLVSSARERANLLETSIDLELQRRVAGALRGHDAAAVILDSDGGVLAAASLSGRRRKKEAEVPAPLDPLVDMVELASVAKLFTLAAALGEDRSLARVVPFTCAQPLQLEAGLFYDWRAHGAMESMTRAIAVSCNLAFARLALELGSDSILRSQSNFGLGREPGSAAGPIRFGPLAGSPSDDRGLVELGSGFAPIRTSLAHAAAIALAIGRGGEFVEPSLVRRRVTLLGAVFEEAAPLRWRAVPAAAAAEIARAMREAVEADDGTAHRLAVDGVTVAAKTGTSGDAAKGLDGIVVGFTPAEHPRYAFAVATREEGRAAGAASEIARAVLLALLDSPNEQ